MTPGAAGPASSSIPVTTAPVRSSAPGRHGRVDEGGIEIGAVDQAKHRLLVGRAASASGPPVEGELEPAGRRRVPAAQVDLGDVRRHPDQPAAAGLVARQLGPFQQQGPGAARAPPPEPHSHRRVPPRRPPRHRRPDALPVCPYRGTQATGARLDFRGQGDRRRSRDRRGDVCARTDPRRATTSQVRERAKAVGGRMAAPRIEGRRVDVGASYFTAPDPEFVAPGRGLV